MAHEPGVAFPPSARFAHGGPAHTRPPHAEQAPPQGPTSPGGSTPAPHTRIPLESGSARAAKTIHVASATASAAYLPIPASPARGKRESADEVFHKLQRFLVAAAAPPAPAKTGTRSPLGLALALVLPGPPETPGGPASASVEERSKSPVRPASVPGSCRGPGAAAEIPCFDLEALGYKDPILLVEALAPQGREAGAIKIRMPAAYIGERACRLNPDTFTFKANRLLNNPPENEVLPRLRFYHELITLHTQDDCEPASTAGPTQTEPPGGGNAEMRQSDAVPAKPAPARGKLPVFLSKLPMMDKRPLDLFAFFRHVLRKGGYAEVINRKLWAQVGRELGYKGKITSSLSSSLKMSYAKILYPLELHLKDTAWELTGDAANGRVAESGRALPEARESEGACGGAKRRHTENGSHGAETVMGPNSAGPDAHGPDRNGIVNTGTDTAGIVGIDSAGVPATDGLGSAETDSTGLDCTDNDAHGPDTHGPGHTGLDGTETESPALKEENEHALPNVALAMNYLGENHDDPPAEKKRKLNNTAPLVLGLAAEFRRSVRLKSAKGFLINSPHLMDLKTPLVISARDPNQDKSEVLISPTGAPAQINNYLKWLASFLSVMQDSPRLEVSSKMATTYSMRQFIERDAAFQDFLIRHYPDIFNSACRSPKPDGRPCVSSKDIESVYWQYLAESPPEFRRLENCPRLPGCFSEGVVNYMGADFAAHKALVYSGTASLAVPGTATDLPSDNYDRNVSLQGLSRDYFAHASRVVTGSLSPFEMANIPYLPNSLLGALSATDLGNSDLVSPSLNIGMTFSTENWRCEDHFTQLCNYLLFGKSRRWYFIPELEFDKFELLVKETVARQNQDIPRVNKNYDSSCWDVESLSGFVTADEESTSTQYECLYNSLENIVSPYPETRVPNDDIVFARIIALKSKMMSLNQEYLITPEMLEERGIKYTTTLQLPGELIYKYPKTYSATISLGFSVSEEINFASKLWLDYSIAGEKWLQTQGVLPSFLTFKMLANFAQMLESADGNSHHFSPAVHAKVLEMFSAMLDTELRLRNSVRQLIKIKEVTIEERNMLDADVVTDDDLLSAMPSKIVIYSKDRSQSIAISLKTFSEYHKIGATLKILDDLTFAELLKNPNYLFELHLFYSDERLKSFHRLLKGFSVDFESWMIKYDEMMNSEEDMVLKNYKALLQDGLKIYSALSGAGDAFDTFCLGKTTNPDILRHMERVKSFKRQVDNLREFVNESCAVVEQCQAILSLKHQQRIRNGASDIADSSEDENLESLLLLVEITNKIPHLNFYTPEFELILEYKNEIQNFDKACRSLIEQGTAAIPEICDMINLGTSFGIQIPSLKFLIRLKRRLQWIETHKTIISGGDPFSGKKEIFSLPDLKNFRDLGMKVLSSKDVPKLEMIDQCLIDGQEYDDSINAYLSRNKRLNDVEIGVLESKLVDMEEKSKWNGKDRIFVKLSTYQKLVDLKRQEKYITFLREFSFKIQSLYETRQILLELSGCLHDYDDNDVRTKMAQGEEWLKKATKILAQAKFFHRNTRANLTAKSICNAALAEKIKLLADRTQIALSDENTDIFKNSSPFLYVHDIQDDANEQGPIRYCLCRDFEDGTMIECDVCHEWFHVNCVKRISQIGKEDDRYICPCCLLLASYQSTSKFPEFSDKVEEQEIFALLKEGEGLQVQPTVELDLLRGLWATIEEARDFLSRPAARVKVVSLGSLYLIFLLRKFIGSPILMSSIVEHLLNLLKYTDLASGFDRKQKHKIEAECNSKNDKSEKQSRSLLENKDKTYDVQPKDELAPISRESEGSSKSEGSREAAKQDPCIQPADCSKMSVPEIDTNSNPETPLATSSTSSNQVITTNLFETIETDQKDKPYTSETQEKPSRSDTIYENGAIFDLQEHDSLSTRQDPAQAGRVTAPTNFQETQLSSASSQVGHDTISPVDVGADYIDPQLDEKVFYLGET